MYNITDYISHQLGPFIALTIEDRAILSGWMLDVVQDLGLPLEIAARAIMILDTFLSVTIPEKYVLQRLGRFNFC